VLQCVAVCCRPSKKGRNSQPLSVEADPLDLRSVIICTPQVTNHFESLCCRVLQCDAVCCSVMQFDAMCCSVWQCGAVCCSVLQCVAVCCNVLQCVTV